MNNTINLSINFPKPECITNNYIDAQCVYQHICKDINQHFQFWGITLIIAYVLIDFILPNLLYLSHKWGFLDRINLFFSTQPHFSLYLEYEDTIFFIHWLKDRLLLAFAVLIAYQLFL